MTAFTIPSGNVSVIPEKGITADFVKKTYQKTVLIPDFDTRKQALLPIDNYPKTAKMQGNQDEMVGFLFSCYYL